MKHIFSLGLFLFLIILSTGLLSQTKETKILTKEITYDVGISNLNRMYSDESMTYDIEGYLDYEYILPDYRDLFLSMLFDQALSNQITIRDRNDRPMNGEDFRKAITSYDTLHVDPVGPPWEARDTIISDVLSPLFDITGIRFREEWSYDTQTLEIYKKTLAYALLTDHYEDYKYTGYEVLCWVVPKQDQGPADNQLLCQRIISRTRLFPDTTENFILNKDSSGTLAYSKKLINIIFKEGLALFYPYPEYYGEVKRIDPNDRFERGFEHDSSVTKLIIERWFDLPPIKLELRPEIITMLGFEEEWYLDLKTMNINKKVVGIKPRITIHSNEEAVPPTLILYALYFNDIWRPFGKTIKIK
jgi:hypothetical protein